MLFIKWLTFIISEIDFFYSISNFKIRFPRLP